MRKGDSLSRREFRAGRELPAGSLSRETVKIILQIRVSAAFAM